MTAYLLFDDQHRFKFLPFTHTRPCAELLCGSFTMRERWELLLGSKTATITEDYLQELFPAQTAEQNIYINSTIRATRELAEHIKGLQPNQALMAGSTLIAICTNAALKNTHHIYEMAQQADQVNCAFEIEQLHFVWDLFRKNEAWQNLDFPLIIQNKKAILTTSATLVNDQNIFIEDGANIGVGVILNATHGPMFIAKGTEIMDGCIIKGPFTLREDATIKMGAKIYGACTIGPNCKVGGEVGNSIFFGNTNKGHDGYLGNSILGEWCNLGADTNSSNLKNNYDEIKIWDEHLNKSVKTGLQFCGLIMGDHSKCGINTMFNTGTVVGVSANVFGAGFPEKFIPSFSWGGAEGQTTYQLNRAIDTANRVMARRNKQLSEAEIKVLQYIFDHTQKQRDIFSNS